MRRFALVLPLLAAAPLHAETLSAEIGRTGLAAVETRLTAQATLTDEERFTLGAVEFLRAVEISFQDRWREGLTDNTGMIPFLRLPIEANPTPARFQPASILALFQKAGAELDKAKATLTAIPDGSDFGATIALDDLWLDVNGDGKREPEEALKLVLGNSLGYDLNSVPPDAPANTPVPAYSFRFDVADAAWLSAYADMLNAFCNLAQAYDPTEPITRILDARKAMDQLGPVEEDWLMGGSHVPDSFDLIAMILATLNQAPDKAHIAAVQSHLQDMITENRLFWARVDREKDDAQEWLPNASQHSAFGLDVPAEAGPTWLAVLDEMEAVLQGKKLVPFWRVGAPAGINLAKFFTDPRPIDVVGWFQGWAALPYLESGTLASGATMDAFDQAVDGQSMLFMLYFN